MSPKPAKQPQETTGKKKSKKKRKAVSPLNDVAGSIVMGGEQNISNNRKVKTKYDSEHFQVASSSPVSDSISYMSLNMSNTGTMSGPGSMPGSGAGAIKLLRPPWAPTNYTTSVIVSYLAKP